MWCRYWGGRQGGTAPLDRGPVGTLALMYTSSTDQLIYSSLRYQTGRGSSGRQKAWRTNKCACPSPARSSTQSVCYNHPLPSTPVSTPARSRAPQKRHTMPAHLYLIQSDLDITDPVIADTLLYRMLCDPSGAHRPISPCDNGHTMYN